MIQIINKENRILENEKHALISMFLHLKILGENRATHRTHKRYLDLKFLEPFFFYGSIDSILNMISQF